MSILFASILGFIVGSVGTLIGAGGGFILIPILLYKFPESTAAEITALSLLIVAANAASGSIAYSRRMQIHWKSAIFYTLSGIPGTIIGVELSTNVDRSLYEKIFGALLVVLSTFLLYKAHLRKPKVLAHVDRARDFHVSTKTIIIGCCISSAVGLVASFAGLGGGIIHVPLLSEALHYPIHLATGTSHFILAVTAAIAVYGHFVAGDYANLEPFVPFLLLSVVIGAQVGARISKLVPRKTILTLLASALIIVGLRLLVAHLALQK